jgi:hypothetical protein
MTEDEKKEIVERMKQEGDLIRNSGTNSIKSMNTRLDKFGEVFSSINENLVKQTAFLQKALDIEVERRREEELNKVSTTKSKPNEKAAEKMTPSAASVAEGGGITAGVSFGTLIGNLLSKTAGWLAKPSSLLGLGSIGAFGKQVLKRLPLVLIAPLIGEFLGNITAKGLEGVGFGEGFSGGIGEFLGKTVNWTLIGGLLGGKLGAKIGFLFGAGKLLYNKVNEAFDVDGNVAAIGESFGVAINEDSGWISAIGTALGIAVVGLATKLSGKLIGLMFAGTAVEKIFKEAAEKVRQPSTSSQKPSGKKTPPKKTTTGKTATPPKPQAQPSAAPSVAPPSSQPPKGGVKSLFGKIAGGARGIVGGPVGAALTGFALFDYVVRSNRLAEEEIRERAVRGETTWSENYDVYGEEPAVPNIGPSLEEILQDKMNNLQLEQEQINQDASVSGVMTESMMMRISEINKEISDVASQIASLKAAKQNKEAAAPQLEITPSQAIERASQLGEKMFSNVDIANAIEKAALVNKEIAKAVSLIGRIATPANNTSNNIVVAPITNAPVNVSNGGNSSAVGVTNTIINGSSGNSYGGLPGVAN